MSHSFKTLKGRPSYTGAGGGMIATSRTLRGDVMTAFEFLCISEREGTLVYTAMPNAGVQTDFTLTKIDADSATFENPAHDFPKMIRYAKRADVEADRSDSRPGSSLPSLRRRCAGQPAAA